jgi:hypothetical protein
MPPGRDDQEIQYAIRELTKEVENLRRESEKQLDERFRTLLKQAEKNEELIRDIEKALELLPNGLDKTIRELFAREFSAERSLEMARKILDGLRQGMHLFLGGTITRPNPASEGGIVPASAFPQRPPNPFTAAAQQEETANEEHRSIVPMKKRDVTASFSIDKEGKVDISVDKSSRLAMAGGIVGIIAAIGWIVQVIVNAVKH